MGNNDFSNYFENFRKRSFGTEILSQEEIDSLLTAINADETSSNVNNFIAKNLNICS